MKRIVGILISLSMVLSLVPFTAFAEEPVLVSGENGNYIVLSDNWELSDALAFEDGKEWVLDLNGFSLLSDGGITVRGGSKLTVVDGSSRGSGEMLFTDGSCLRVEGFEGEAEGNYMDGTVDYGRTTSVDSSIIIKGGSLVSDGDSVIEVTGCGARLDVSGGSIKNTGSASPETVAIRTFREKNSGGVHIRVSGGEISCESGSAISLKCGGDFEICGKNTIIEGRQGIEIFSGSLAVEENPYIKGLGNGFDIAEIYSEEGLIDSIYGSDYETESELLSPDTGSALAIISEAPGEYYGDMEINISGGTFVSESSFAVSEFSRSYEEGLLSGSLRLFKITDGCFAGKDEDIYSENRNRFISGGFFAHNPSSMVTSSSIYRETGDSLYKYMVIGTTESDDSDKDRISDESEDTDEAPGSEKSKSSGETSAGLFSDVSQDEYFYDSVIWAVSEGITNGVSEELFLPFEACTRAQALTYLWRLAGEPVCGSNGFTDVKLSDYFHDAVTWAEDRGITNGVSEGLFCPDEKVTRGQLITFLMRYAENIDGRTTNCSDTAIFVDVRRSDYYYNAVQWAVNEGITLGRTARTFAPEEICTRAETVTFLKRYKG